jgi:hypothetical protein
MRAKHLVATFVGIALAGGGALAQPARGPSHYEVVDAAGTRERLIADPSEIAILAAQVSARGFERQRRALRMICSHPCPAALPASRAAQDTIEWRDGRRTMGPVFVYREVVEQNGRHAGRLGDVRTLELGTRRPAGRLASALDPLEIGAYWDDPFDGGEYVTFRRPWLSLTASEIVFHGRPPIPRDGNLRRITIAPGYPQPSREWPTEDVVVWTDGTRTTGAVAIRGGFIDQAGQRRRPLRDASHIELARR